MMQGFVFCVVCCCSTMSVYLYFLLNERNSFPSAFSLLYFSISFIFTLLYFIWRGEKLMINLSYFTREILFSAPEFCCCFVILTKDLFLPLEQLHNIFNFLT